MRAKWSLTTKLTLSYAALIIFILLLTMGYLLRMETNHVTELVDTTISSVAGTLSEDPAIITALEKDRMDETTARYLDEINQNQGYVDYVVVVNSDDIRLYHTEKEKIGLQFQGGDESEALKGSKDYITEGKGTQEYQRRCFASVYNEKSEPIGFVMVSAYTRSISDVKKHEIMKYLAIMAVAMIIGVLFAYIIGKNVRKSLLGYEPTQLSQKFLQREEILATLGEGLLLINKNGECEYANPSAERIFQVDGEQAQENQKIQEFIKRYITAEPAQNEALRHYQLQIEDATLLMDRIPIKSRQEVIGTLVLLNDKTETTKLAEELTGVNHIIAALRATTHEHKNKLHVILGLLQIGNTREAMEYINSSASAQEDDSAILNCIQNKTIAALILGKKNRAKELNIAFNLSKDSFLEAHNEYLPAADLVTIIGNLIENAFDALYNVEKTREVDLYINSGQKGLTIIVDDTGMGMEQETVERLLHGSYTTKGEGHGVGLTLIRNIVDRCEGILEIESEPGEGSSFSVTIHKKRTY